MLKKGKVACTKRPLCPGFGDCENDVGCKAKQIEQVEVKPKRTNNEHHHLYKKWMWYGYLRPNQLRAYPLCERCLGQQRICPATVVDHIEPHKGDLPKFMDTDNFQSLCWSCHSYKTAEEAKGNILDFRDSRHLQEK